MKLSKIKIVKAKISPNKKGDLLKYINKDNKHLKTFGEVYFTEIKEKKNKRLEFPQKMPLFASCSIWQSEVYIC